MDPLISLVIMVIILASTWNLLRDTLSLSMDAVPSNIKIENIRQTALKLSGVKDIHHIHVWAMSTAENALTAHLVISDQYGMRKPQVSKMNSNTNFSIWEFGVSPLRPK